MKGVTHGHRQCLSLQVANDWHVSSEALSLLFRAGLGLLHVVALHYTAPGLSGDHCWNKDPASLMPSNLPGALEPVRKKHVEPANMLPALEKLTRAAREQKLTTDLFCCSLLAGGRKFASNAFGRVCRYCTKPRIRFTIFLGLGPEQRGKCRASWAQSWDTDQSVLKLLGLRRVLGRNGTLNSQLDSLSSGLHFGRCVRRRCLWSAPCSAATAAVPPLLGTEGFAKFAPVAGAMAPLSCKLLFPKP